MRLLMAITAAGMMLSGCMQDISAQSDIFARDAAKGVVNNVVQSRFPGVNAAPFTDCIIDNATSSEILRIAESALVGANQATTNLVLQIAERPETVQCMFRNQGLAL